MQPLAAVQTVWATGGSQDGDYLPAPNAEFAVAVVSLLLLLLLLWLVAKAVRRR